MEPLQSMPSKRLYASFNRYEIEPLLTKDLHSFVNINIFQGNPMHRRVHDLNFSAFCRFCPFFFHR